MYLLSDNKDILGILSPLLLKAVFELVPCLYFTRCLIIKIHIKIKINKIEELEPAIEYVKI